MKYINIFFVLMSCNVFSEVTCNLVPVTNIASASGPGFHGMNKGGASGAYLYLKVAPSLCKASGNEDIAKGVYLVIDEIGNHQRSDYEIKQYWLSIMVAAKAAKRTLSFSGEAGGKNSHNITVVEPFSFSVN